MRLFLMVCSRDFQGVVCIHGEPGGVADGLCDGVLLTGSLGLVTGELLGLPDKLAFLLKQNKIHARELHKKQYTNKDTSFYF